MNGIQVPEIWMCRLFDSGASKCIQTTTTAISLPFLGSHPPMDPHNNFWGCEVWPPHLSRLARAPARQTQTPVNATENGQGITRLVGDVVSR